MTKKYLARYPKGNPHRLWRQDNFIFSTFSPGVMSLDDDSEEACAVIRRSVKTCVDAGFNLIELGWVSPRRGKEAVKMCEQLGVGVIYQNLKRFGGMGKRPPFCETNDLLGSMDEMRRWKSVIGYYIWDEPHTVEKMEEIRKMMDLCQREDPTTLPFTVALPSYSKDCLWENNGYATYITNYADIIDPPVMSFDYYPVGKEERFAADLRAGLQNDTVQLDATPMWCDMEYFRRAAKAREIPFWFYYQGQNLHHVPHFRFDMTRLIMHGALLHGVKGLQHYSAVDAVTDRETGGKGPYFEDQKAIHARLRNWGNILMALECDRVIHDDALLPDFEPMNALRTPMAESTILTGALPYRCSISELSDEYGNRYLMVLNRDYLTDAQFTLALKKASRVYEISDENGEERLFADNASSLSISLAPGAMAFFRVQDAAEAPFLVEYYLEKDII